MMVHDPEQEERRLQYLGLVTRVRRQPGLARGILYRTKLQGWRFEEVAADCAAETSNCTVSNGAGSGR